MHGIEDELAAVVDAGMAGVVQLVNLLRDVGNYLPRQPNLQQCDKGGGSHWEGDVLSVRKPQARAGKAGAAPRYTGVMARCVGTTNCQRMPQQQPESIYAVVEQRNRMDTELEMPRGLVLLAAKAHRFRHTAEMIDTRNV
jgi:hypothetical protein